MSRERIPYFDFYPSDFMHGVRGLSAQEVGVYTMMLCRIYEENGPVEYHVRRLATYCGMREATFKKAVETLVDLGKLEIANGMISNRRAEAEISSRANKLKINSKAGKASAEKRQQKQAQSSTDVQQAFNHTDTDTKEAKASSAPALDADEMDRLKSKLLDAAGEKIQPIGAINLGPILGLVSSGVDLETDVLPTIRSLVARMKRPAGSWAYFVDAIKDAYNARIKAGEGLAKPVRIVTPDDELSPEALEAQWRKRLTYARDYRCWFTSVWGPMPGLEDCRVPKQFLQEGDGFDRNGYRWTEQSSRAA